MSRYKSKPLEIPREALLKAIDRCEHGTNPAIVETRKCVVHVRKQFDGSVSMAWVIRVIGKSTQGVNE